MWPAALDEFDSPGDKVCHIRHAAVTQFYVTAVADLV